MYVKFIVKHDTLKICIFFIEQDIVDGGSISTIKSVLSEMKSMLNTPIKAFSTEDSSQIPSSPPPSPVSEDGYSIPEGDVSGQFTRVMWKGNVQAAWSKVKKNMTLSHFDSSLRVYLKYFGIIIVRGNQ